MQYHAGISPRSMREYTPSELAALHKYHVEQRERDGGSDELT